MVLVLASFGGSPIATSQDTYTIPKDIRPVSDWSDGFTADEAEAFRQAYVASDIFAGNDRSAFAFLNLSEVVPTGIVQRSGMVAPLERAPIDGVTEVVAASEFGRMSLGELIDDPRSRIQAWMVLHDGKVVFEAYPGMPREMKHLWSSTAKTITGLLVHQLVSEDLIDLDADVSDYLDFTVGTPVGAIKVEDVLHMRSGLDFVENQANRTDPEHPVSWAFAAALSERGVPAGKSLKEIVVDIGASDAPGTIYGYSTFNTQILIFIIEEVTRKPWNRVVSERIWQKAGMESEGLVAVSPRGEILGGGIFAGTLEDFARYALLYTPSWNAVASDPVVSADFFDKVRAAVMPETYKIGDQGPRMIATFREQGVPDGNAYQWDAVFPDGDLYKSGLLGQGLYVSPKTDSAVIWFSTTWQNAHPGPAYARAIVNKLFRK